MEQAQFEPASEEPYLRIIQMAGNAGATDEHRALNYMAVRCPVIYSTTAEQLEIFNHIFLKANRY
jgi:hypothetical protein